MANENCYNDSLLVRIWESFWQCLCDLEEFQLLSVLKMQKCWLVKKVFGVLSGGTKSFLIASSLMSNLSV